MRSLGFNLCHIMLKAKVKELLILDVECMAFFFGIKYINTVTEMIVV